MSVFPARLRSVGAVRAVSLWERFIGGDGLTLVLVGFVLFTVVMPVQEGNWAPGMPAPVVIGLLAGASGWAMYQRGWTTRRTVLTTLAAGAFLTAYAGTATAKGFPVTVRADQRQSRTS